MSPSWKKEELYIHFISHSARYTLHIAHMNYTLHIAYFAPLALYFCCFCVLIWFNTFSRFCFKAYEFFTWSDQILITLIFLLKFLSVLFFMYLWIFLFLSSTESLPTLNVGSSKLEISDARAEEAVVVAPPWYRFWLSLLSPLIVTIFIQVIKHNQNNTYI